MTDKEILGELKCAYELLLDISDNQDRQISLKHEQKVNEIMYEISIIYYDLVRKTEEDLSIDNEYKIPLIIGADYEDKNNGYYYTKADYAEDKELKEEYIWWQDYEFMQELK